MLTEKACIGRVPGRGADLLQPETVITYAGRPAPHMKPLDAGAAQAVEPFFSVGSIGIIGWV
jgi:hypothetical protein